MKTARNQEQAWEIEDKRDGEPHGWLQWKGTDMCMDLHCECGTQSHVDGEFGYTVRCPACNTIYSCNGHIELIKLEQEPEGTILLGL